MKSYKQFMEGHKTCPKGEYYCYTDKKCKKIPGGYHVGRGGYLERDDNNDSEETNGSKNGSSNGSNGSNGNGNGGNGSGGNGGGGE
jgi:hypothetical protein|tara:strand:- start:501 stop:758 length:258 start_codon:yes stop_codon:yes gene_type:complete